jgi:hypothetical protein
MDLDLAMVKGSGMGLDWDLVRAKDLVMGLVMAKENDWLPS